MEHHDPEPQPALVTRPKSAKTTQQIARAEEHAAARAEQAVSKANEAIAIRPKRGKLTLLSRRIYNVFLYHAQRQGVDNASYSILLSELIDDARFTSNNTELLKSHIRDMQATTIDCLKMRCHCFKNCCQGNAYLFIDAKVRCN